MRTPSVRYADDLKKWDTDACINGRWVCARPESMFGLFFFWRLRLAWKVFLGDCDVLAWKGGQSKL